MSLADLVLTGHTEEARFAVAICSAEPLIASGGDDREVCRAMFSLHEFVCCIHDTSRILRRGRISKVSSSLHNLLSLVEALMQRVVMLCTSACKARCKASCTL
jgi:hypothetical protein